MGNNHLYVFILSVFISSCSQIILKISARKTYKSRIREYLNFGVLAGYGLFFLATLLTIYGYKGVELKYGPVVNSLGYIFILILGRVFLGEKITRNKILGNLLIVIGIIVFSL